MATFTRSADEPISKACLVVKDGSSATNAALCNADGTPTGISAAACALGETLTAYEFDGETVSVIAEESIKVGDRVQPANRGLVKRYAGGAQLGTATSAAKGKNDVFTMLGGSWSTVGGGLDMEERDAGTVYDIGDPLVYDPITGEVYRGDGATPGGVSVELDVDATSANVLTAIEGMNATQMSSASTALTGRAIRNVISYGAIGDGMTNDTVAIQAAITAAAAGDVVFFPPGRYLVTHSTLYVEKNIDLIGVRGHSVLVNTGAPGYWTLTCRSIVGTGTLATLSENVYESGDLIRVVSAASLAAKTWYQLYDSYSFTSGYAITIANVEKIYVESITGLELSIAGTLTRRFSTVRGAVIRGFTTGPVSVNVIGLTFDGGSLVCTDLLDSRAQDCTVLDNDSGNYLISRCHNFSLINCVSRCSRAKTGSGFGYGFNISGGAHTRIVGHEASNVKECVITAGARNVTVTNCLFQAMASDFNTHGADVQGVSITNCRFIGCGLATSGGGDFQDSRIVISGNRFEWADNGLRVVDIGGACFRAATFNVATHSVGLTTGDHCVRHGRLVQFTGTLPAELVLGTQYHCVAPTATDMVLSSTEPYPPRIVTVPYSRQGVNLNISSDYAFVLHGGVPTGLTAGVRYWTRSAESNYNGISKVRGGQACTFEAVADTVTIAGVDNWVNDERIAFQTTGTMPDTLFERTRYWLIGKAGSTFQVSATQGGPAIPFGTIGSGTIYAVIGFEDDASGNTIWAEAGSGMALSGAPAGNNMHTVQQDVVFTGNLLTGHLDYAALVYRANNVVFSGNTLNAHTGDYLNDSVSIDVSYSKTCRFASNVIKNLNYSASGVTINQCDDIVFSDNTFTIPHFETIFNIATNPSTNLVIRNNTFTRCVTRALAINPALLGVTVGGNTYMGSGYTEGSEIPQVTSASLATIVPGTTANVIVASADLGGDITWDLDDLALKKGDWVKLVRRGGGASHSLTVRKKSDSSAIYTFADTPEYGYVCISATGDGTYAITDSYRTTTAPSAP